MRDAADLDQWKKQLDHQRSYFQTKYASYRSSAVADCRHDSKALWSKLSVPLRSPMATMSITNYLLDCLTIIGLDRTYHAHHFIFSFTF